MENIYPPPFAKELVPICDLIQGCQPFGTKKCPIFSEKMPQMGFFLKRTSENMPNTQKRGIFMLYCIFINEGKCPMAKKVPFLRKRH